MLALAQGLARKLKDISDREKIMSLQDGTSSSWVASFPQLFLMINYFVIWALIMHLLTHENWLHTFESWLNL